MNNKEKINCQGKDCSAEVYKDNLCVKHYEEANPNIKGWKCDICQRLCGEDEQFTTLAEKQNTKDPKVAEEFRKKYPYGITYCPECKAKADEEAKKAKQEQKKAEQKSEEKTEISEGLCQTCQNELNIDLKDWEKNRQRIKAEAVKCDGHNSTSIRYYNKKGECIGNQYKGSTTTKAQCKSCNENSIERSAWYDYPPCPLCINSRNSNQLEENNQEPELAKLKPVDKKEPEGTKKLEDFDHKLPDKIKPTKAEEVEKLLSLDQVEEYFIRENISKIERKDGRLIITFTDEKSVDKNTLTIKEQQKLSQFLATSNLKELSSEDLSKRMGSSSKSQRNNPNRISPAWFIGGCVFILLAAGIVWKVIKSKNPA